MPVSFPLLLYADEKTERTKKQFPSECRSVFSSRLQNAPEQKKLSNFLQTRTAAAEPDGFPVFLFSYFPHSIQKPDRQFCPVRFLSTYVFSSEHTQHSPVFRGQRLNRTSCHPAPELFRSVPAQRSLPEPVSLPVRAAV